MAWRRLPIAAPAHRQRTRVPVQPRQNSLTQKGRRGAVPRPNLAISGESEKGNRQTTTKRLAGVSCGCAQVLFGLPVSRQILLNPQTTRGHSSEGHGCLSTPRMVKGSKPSSTNETLASPGPPMALHRRRSRSASLEIPSRGQGRRKWPERDGQSSTRAACAAQCGGKVPEPIIIIQPTPQRVAPCGLPGSGPGGASPFFGGKGGGRGGWRGEPYQRHRHRTPQRRRGLGFVGQRPLFRLVPVPALPLAPPCLSPQPAPRRVRLAQDGSW